MNQFLAFTKTIFISKDNNNCDGQIVLRFVIGIQHTLQFYNNII